MQTVASSPKTESPSVPTSSTTIALDGSVAISWSVVRFAFPMPHANTVTPPSLTSVAASMDVCRSDLSGAASTDCSPSEMNSTNLATPWRPSCVMCGTNGGGRLAGLCLYVRLCVVFCIVQPWQLGDQLAATNLQLDDEYSFQTCFRRPRAIKKRTGSPSSFF